MNDVNLCNLISSLQRRKDTNILLLGDFNHPQINWNLPSTSCAPKASKEFQKCIFENFLYQVVTAPTRYRLDNIPSLLDLIITNNEDIVSPPNFIPPLGKSDHVFIEFQIQQMTHTVSSTPHYQFCKADFPGLRSFLKEIIWPTFNSVEDFAKYFTKTFLEAANSYIPMRKSRLTKPNCKVNFINKETLTLIRRKHLLWQRYCETRSPQKWNDYARIRNQVKSRMRKLRYKKEVKVSEDCKDNPKSFWKYVNSKRKNSQQMPNLTDSNTCADTDIEKAELLSNILSEVMTVEPNVDAPDESNPEGLSDIKIDQREVVYLLENLNVNKSPDVDGFHPRILKETAYRRLRGDLIQLYHIFKDPKHALHQLITRRDDTFPPTRGHNRKLFKDHVRWNVQKFSLPYRTANHWNSLPYEVVHLPKINRFKRSWDAHLVNLHFSTRIRGYH